MHLIPPTELPKPRFRAQLVAAVVGGGIGVVIALLAWFVTGEAHWFFVVPIGALVGIWVRTQRPNVIWMRHG